MPGNVLDGVPEQLGVVDAERGDAADLGRADDVGRVVLAADADLHSEWTSQSRDSSHELANMPFLGEIERVLSNFQGNFLQ